MNKYKKQCPECRGDGVARPEPGIDYLCPSCCGSGKIEDPMESPAKAMQGPLDDESDAVKASAFMDDLIKGCKPPSALECEIQRRVYYMGLISEEVTRAKSKFPYWPTDPMHAFAIVAEEFGEAAKEVLQLTYEPTKSTVERIRTETIQLAAMCHRFLESLYRYEFKPSSQHSQS